MGSIDSVIVSWDFSSGEDDGLLIVGKKTLNDGAEIINAFQGKEAEEIFLKLVTKRLKK